MSRQPTALISRTVHGKGDSPFGHRRSAQLRAPAPTAPPTATAATTGTCLPGA